MSELFTVVTPGDALAMLLNAATPIERSETVPLGQARGRVLDRSIIAVETIPHFPRALMDGFAVRAADTRGASDAAPAYLRLTGEVLMGTVPAGSVGPYEAMRIHTGAMLPPNADAVVMMEETNLHGAEVEVRAAAQHVTQARGGEGAAREFCDLLLVSGGQYAALLAGQEPHA